MKEKGNILYKKRRYDQALSQYKKSLALLPHDPAILTNIAQCYLRQKQYDDAIEFCTRCLFVSQNYTKALSRRAMAYRKQGRLEKALEDLKQARAIHHRVANSMENADNTPTPTQSIIDAIEIEYRECLAEYDDNVVEAAIRQKLSVDQPSGMLLQQLNRLLNHCQGEVPINKKEEAQANHVLGEQELGQVKAMGGPYKVISALISTNEDAQILLRTSGFLSWLQHKWISTCCVGMERRMVNEVLALFCRAAQNNRRNQELFCTELFIQTLFDLLQQPDQKYHAPGIFEFIQSLCVNKDWRQLLLHHSIGLSAILSTIQKPALDPSLTTICINIVYQLCVPTFSPMFDSVSPDPVLIFTHILGVGKKSPVFRQNIREEAVEILVQCSTRRTYRSAVIHSDFVQQQVISSLLGVLQSGDSDSIGTKEHALSVLLNFCVQVRANEVI